VDELVFYDFRIDAWRPETLPLKRLAEYAAELAKLFGSTEHVHLMKVRAGSAIPELAVARTAQYQVEQRLSLVGTQNAPDDLVKVFQQLNQLLREDGASAALRHKGGAKIIDFPGRKTKLAEEVVIHEAGILEGTVIRVGGTDDTVPVWLEDENKEKLKCTATRALARELAGHLFGDPVRVNGQGSWRRGSDRKWHLERFTIKHWDALATDSLTSVVAGLRSVEGSGWNDMADAQAHWRSLRSEP
jgi:hypothetical protein